MSETSSEALERIALSHFRGDDDFKPGFRPNSSYRDLGVEKATNGLAMAHVVRAARPFPKEGVGGPHRHLVHFQFCYMIRGWQKMRFAGHDEVITATAGTSWIQPSGIVHEVLGFSDDREILEVILPAKYETVDGRYDEPDALHRAMRSPT
ncbi:cupin domain-containing protein [Ramlibacter sp.]|uniref:cupin domain-containing protein n=1 Tax=Ramlibacter sp. TaxID=1917967 RepID=UPI003D102CDC